MIIACTMIECGSNQPPVVVDKLPGDDYLGRRTHKNRNKSRQVHFYQFSFLDPLARVPGTSQAPSLQQCFLSEKGP